MKGVDGALDRRPIEQLVGRSFGGVTGRGSVARPAIAATGAAAHAVSPSNEQTNEAGLLRLQATCRVMVG